jgi:hypothetical protein
MIDFNIFFLVTKTEQYYTAICTVQIISSLHKQSHTSSHFFFFTIQKHVLVYSVILKEMIKPPKRMIQCTQPVMKQGHRVNDENSQGKGMMPTIA